MFRFATLMIVGAVLAAVSRGQGLLDQLNFSRSNIEGLHLYGVSANSGYSTYDFSSSSGVVNSSLRSRLNYGVSATVGWQRFHGRTSFAIRYTGGYNGDYYLKRNSLNHNLSATVSRTLGPKWSISLSASAQEADLTQSIFEPSSLVLLTQSGAVFDDLAASQSIGQYSSVASSLTLTGGVSAAAINTLLLGSRVLTYNITTSLTYAYSSRLRFSIGSFGTGGQRRTDTTASGVQNYVLPRTLGGTASASMSYDLSPRTDFAVGVSQDYINTRYQKSTATSSTVGLGRKMGKNWFLSGNGGIFIAEKSQQSVGVPPMRQAVWGGSLGFRTRSNSIVATYNRTGQEIGAAAAIGRNTRIAGSWSWRPARRGWNLNVNLNHYELANTGFVAVTGWQVGAGVNRSLARNLSLSFNYSYLISNSEFLAHTNHVNVNSVRLSLSWAPRLWRETQGLQEADQ